MDRTTTTLPTAGCERRELDLRSTAARRLCRIVSRPEHHHGLLGEQTSALGPARSQVLADGGYGFGLRLNRQRSPEHVDATADEAGRVARVTAELRPTEVLWHIAAIRERAGR